ncbi:MAG: glutamate 5-kinase [Candidatus Omnitrophota bacterium]
MERKLPVNPKRIVVKVGTGILTSPNYLPNKAWIKKLTAQIAALITDQNIQVILVTSGAIGAGMGLLGLSARPKLLPQQQAAAAIGQSQLMKIYNSFFKAHNLLTAQILLTNEDLSSRQRYLNAKNTLLTLLNYKVIPIINENDTVSVEEIKFGDNDRLSALVAALIQADLLIILSDVDGLYTGGIEKSKPGQKKAILPLVAEITPEIEKLATAGKSKAGTGGMISKIAAAKICGTTGLPCVIANGKTPGILDKILANKNIGTLFLPQEEQLAGKKRWIRFNTKVKGQIIVDEGAKEALSLKNKSLLPKGITAVQGSFAIGDTISILDQQGQEFARGLANYSSEELHKIKGQKSSQIEAVLGYKYYDEVIHRDNLVIL